MAWYRVLSRRLTLAPEGEEVEIEDSVLAARLLAGGHIVPIDAEDAQFSTDIASDGMFTSSAGAERDPSEESGSQILTVSSKDTDTKGQT